MSRILTGQFLDGEVVLKRATAGEVDDPVLGSFLEFLATDMTKHPERLRPIDTCIAQRIQSLVSSVEFDLNANLPEKG